MSGEFSRMIKQLEHINFCIWLFSRYKGKTAEEIVDFYIERKMSLIEKFIKSAGEYNGVDKDEDV